MEVRKPGHVWRLKAGETRDAGNSSRRVLAVLVLAAPAEGRGYDTKDVRTSGYSLKSSSSTGARGVAIIVVGRGAVGFSGWALPFVCAGFFRALLSGVRRALQDAHPGWTLLFASRLHHAAPVR